MYDFYSEQLLADAANFEPRHGNRCFDMIESADKSFTCQDYAIEESDIPHWIGAEAVRGESEPVLRLLIGAPEQHKSDAEILPLPFSRSTYEAICETWRLPKEFLRMLLSTLPLNVVFTTTDGQGQPVKGLMLRASRSRDWNFCLAILYNPATGFTRGIVNGMQQDEVAKLVLCLRGSKGHARDPRLLPIFLLELRVHFFAILLEKRALGIEGIESSTGMRHGFSKDPRKAALTEIERRNSSRLLDFDPITQKLTGVTGTLSFCDMTFSSSKRALDAAAAFRPVYKTERANMAVDDGNAESNNELAGRIDYLYELIEGAQAYAAVLSSRTKAQVQTVYSMIGQRDNRLNIETAAASREIAEDSRRVALLTRKDSLDMRIIAGVTLVFLPGTFMATMFGSGFFRFFPEDSTKIVSEWIWLYWLLTVSVTAAVLLLWVYLSRRHAWTLFSPEKQQLRVLGN